MLSVVPLNKETYEEVAQLVSSLALNKDEQWFNTRSDGRRSVPVPAAEPATLYRLCHRTGPCFFNVAKPAQGCQSLDAQD